MEHYYIGVVILVVCAIQGAVANLPVDFLMEERMSKVKNISDWCSLMNLPDCEKVLEDAIPSEGVDETGEKMVVTGGDTPEMARFDPCNPREMTIVIPRHPDPDITVWPTCTRAMRCGGCCTSDVFSCEPTETREKFVKVFDTRLPYVGAHRFQFMGVRSVKIIEHVQCDAQCKTKKHECHKYQTYEARKCRCVCRPERLALQSTCNDVQIWDDSECDCICPNRNTIICPEPSYFSTTTCKCTLKTSVSGEIDLDKLFQQLVASNIHLKEGQENDVNAEHEISILTGLASGQNSDLTTETEGSSESEGTGVTGEGESEVEGTGQQKEMAQPEKKTTTTESTTTSTTTEKMTTTTTLPQTTTTQEPTTTKDPCASTKCFGVWKPRLLSNGRCQCFPPSPIG